MMNGVYSKDKVIGRWTDGIIESGPVKMMTMFCWLVNTAVFVLVMIEKTMARAFNDWYYQWTTFFSIIGFLHIMLMFVTMFEQNNSSKFGAGVIDNAKKIGLNAILARAALGIIFMVILATWSGVIEKKLELNDTHRVAFENSRYDTILPANMDMRYYIRFQECLSLFITYWALDTLHYLVYIGFRVPNVIVDAISTKK